MALVFFGDSSSALSRISSRHLQTLQPIGGTTAEAVDLYTTFLQPREYPTTSTTRSQQALETD